MRKEKKRIIQKNGSSNLLVNQLVNSSVKKYLYLFCHYNTKRRIPKKECACPKLQRSLRYLRVNSVQVAHESASFVDIRGTLE